MTTILDKYMLISSVQGRETFFAHTIGFSGLANSNMLSEFFREQMTFLWQPNFGKKQNCNNYFITSDLCEIPSEFVFRGCFGSLNSIMLNTVNRVLPWELNFEKMH